MNGWECSVCGYIHEGEEPPLECPVCKAEKEKFREREFLSYDECDKKR